MNQVKNLLIRLNVGSIIIINDFGLSAKNEVKEFYLSEESSSIFKPTHESSKIVTVKMKNILDYISENKIEKINLMKINIEGGEFELLNILIESQTIKIIENILVQFHSFVKNAERKRIKIQSRLNKTHSITFEYPFVWENWVLKEITKNK